MLQTHFKNSFLHWLHWDKAIRNRALPALHQGKFCFRTFCMQENRLKINAQDTEDSLSLRFQLILACSSVSWKSFKMSTGKEIVLWQGWPLFTCVGWITFRISITFRIPKFSFLSTWVVQKLLFDICLPVLCQGGVTKCFFLPAFSHPTKSTPYIKHKQKLDNPTGFLCISMSHSQCLPSSEHHSSSKKNK